MDGKPRALRYFDRDDDLPLTLGMLVDTSMSQQGILPEERTASEKFLDGMLRVPGGAGTTPAQEPDRSFVLQFDIENTLLEDLTDDKAKLTAGLEALQTPLDRRRALEKAQGTHTPLERGPGGGYRGLLGTTLFDAVYLAANDVMTKEHGRKAVILITDGGDHGSKKTMEQAIEAAQRADTVVYAIYFAGGGGFHPFGGGGFGNHFAAQGLGPDLDGKQVLRAMAAATGGRMFEVSGKQTIAVIYTEIGAELRSQYRLGYSPEGEAAGFHKIAVTVARDKKWKVQAREGYYAK